MRQLVGYGRLEDPRAAELLNELYAKEWGWFRNFFCPVMKLGVCSARALFRSGLAPFSRS